MAETKAYTLGRGKVLFKPQGAAGFDDFGNVTDFKTTFAIEKKEHFSSRSGLKVKDKEIVVSLAANLSFTADELSKGNLEKFLLADSSPEAQTAGTLASPTAITVAMGKWFEVGEYNLGNDIAVKDSADNTTYTEGVDYILDKKAGLIYIIPGGAIADGDVIHVSGSYGAVNNAVRFDAGVKTSIVGELYFVADPAAGAAIDVRGQVNLTPNGDLSLITDDWATIEFTGSFVKQADVQRIFSALSRTIV